MSPSEKALVIEAAGVNTFADPLGEAERILRGADALGLTLRAAGGVAIALICPSARRPPLKRSYNDIDFICGSRQAHTVGAMLEVIGYAPHREFNAINGQDRLFFNDVSHAREVDIFVDRINGAHELKLSDRLQKASQTLSPADLLLSKLQVYETNTKDMIDVIALLSDQPLTTDGSGIDLRHVCAVCGSDWGWWRTVTLVVERVRAFAHDGGFSDLSPVVGEKLDVLAEALETAPKSSRWKLRARLGERVRWYEVPEAVEH